MIKFTVSLSKFLFLLLNLLLISVVSMAAVQIIPAESVTLQAWFADNWTILLLALSEILALLPGSKSGILKIIIFLLKRLTAIKSSKSKS